MAKVRTLFPLLIGGGGIGTPNSAGAAGRCARSSRGRVELAQPGSKSVIDNARTDNSRRAGRLRAGRSGISGGLFFIEGFDLGLQVAGEALLIGEALGRLGRDLHGRGFLAGDLSLVGGFFGGRLLGPLGANPVAVEDPAADEGGEAPSDRRGCERQDGATGGAEEGEKESGHQPCTPS